MPVPCHHTPVCLVFALCIAVLAGCDGASDADPAGRSDANDAPITANGDEPSADRSGGDGSPSGDGADADERTSTPGDDPRGDGEGVGGGASNESDGGSDERDVEAAIARVESMVDRAAFTEAYQEARALQRQFQSHPRRRAIDRLVARMAQLNREARGLDRLIDKLDAPDTEVRHIARERIVRSGEAGMIALRHTVRTREDRTAIGAAELLASLGDEMAGPLFASRLAEGVAPALHEVLAANLDRVAPDADPKVLGTLLPIIERDGAQERLTIAGYLIDTAADAAGQDPQRWAELCGDAQAYQTLRRYVQRALDRDDQPALIKWGAAYAVPLELFESGLRAEFFADPNLGEPIGSRLVRQVSHDRNASPIEGLADTSISARWTGHLLVPRDGKYTLYTSTDDGVRLWVDGKQVVNAWTGRGETEDRAPIELSAGLHEIRLEWYQGGGDYAVHLRWEGPGIEKQPISQDHLRTMPWPGMDHDLDD